MSIKKYEYYILECKRGQKVHGVDAMRAKGWCVTGITSNYKGGIYISMQRLIDCI